MSWSCNIAGFRNSICHIENHFRHILFFFVFNAVSSLTSGGFRIVSDTLVLFKSNAKLCTSRQSLFEVKSTHLYAIGRECYNGCHSSLWRNVEIRSLSTPEAQYPLTGRHQFCRVFSRPMLNCVLQNVMPVHSRVSFPSWVSSTRVHVVAHPFILLLFTFYNGYLNQIWYRDQPPRLM